jgi:hypothetical protein
LLSLIPSPRCSWWIENCPVDARLEAFNPLVPADAEASGLPVAILRYALHNKTDEPITAAVCANLPNCIGNDGSETRRDWKGDPYPVGEKGNRNVYREGRAIRGVFMDSTGVDPKAAAWGTMALTTTASEGVTHRTSWEQRGWGGGLLDFWDDFSADGIPEERAPAGDAPMATLSVRVDLPPHTTRKVTFIIAWHFPNRRTWTPANPETDEDIIGNSTPAGSRCLGGGGKCGGGSRTPRTPDRRRLCARSAKAICRSRSRKPRCSTSAPCAARPVSGRPTAICLVSRVARPSGAAVMAPARTSGITRSPRHSCSATSPDHARDRVRPRHR